MRVLLLEVLTIAVPLSYKFVFRQWVDVPSKDLVHVKPYTSMMPQNQQSDCVSIHPTLFVEHSAASCFLWEHALELGTFCQIRQICLTYFEVVFPFLQERPDESIVRDHVPAIRPQDQFGIAERLSSEEGG